jgi:hypothetical protein
MKTIDFIAAQVSEHLTKGTTHEHYDRTLSVAKFGYDMITGENTRDYLDEIRGRETREEKEQRNKLTNTLTPYLCNRVERVFRKAERATGLSFTGASRSKSTSSTFPTPSTSPTRTLGCFSCSRTTTTTAPSARASIRK